MSLRSRRVQVRILLGILNSFLLNDVGIAFLCGVLRPCEPTVAGFNAELERSLGQDEL
jgi:hypothetical protein